MTSRSVAPVEKLSEGVEPGFREVNFEWPWWMHPGSALLILAGSTAAFSIAIPPDAYATWKVLKYLDLEQSSLLVIGMVAMLVGIAATSLRVWRSGPVKVKFEIGQVNFLRRTYKVLLILTLLGYGFWMLSAMQQGVSFSDLARVLQRETSAIGELKSNSRPVAGLTTLTQFGPVAVTVAVLLKRMGDRNHSFLIVIALAAFRAYFYAERLAIIEVLIPMLVVYAVTVSSGSRLKWLVRWGPLLGAPAVWTIFAISEYSRSWVYYQQIVQISFPEWVTTRLLGYYVTSYNNSALFNQAWPDNGALPYYSVVGFWNAPIIENVLKHPGVDGMPINTWWSSILINYANYDFTNSGSFLLTNAEFGSLGMVLIWVTIGVVLGSVYSSLRVGHVPALIAYSVIFVGILEIPRFIYWTNGRAFPVIIAILVVAIFYPKGTSVRKTVVRRFAPQSLPKKSAEPSRSPFVRRSTK